MEDAPQPDAGAKTGSDDPRAPGGSLFAPIEFSISERPGVGWIGYRKSALTPSGYARERRALTRILVGAVLLVAAETLSSIVDFGSSLGLWTFQFGVSGVELKVTSTFLALAIASCLVEMAAVLLAWTAFRTLATLDDLFVTPAKLPILLVIALGLLAVVLEPVLSQLSSAVACVGSPGGGSLAACLPAALGDLLALCVAIAVLAATGYVGLQMGFWRMGARYDNGLFPAGAALSFIPVLSVAGAILIALGARSARAGEPGILRAR